jgi:polynucleotide 5'-kinase involved in rRNA processing
LNWQITGIEQVNGLITEAHYYVSLNGVDTQGTHVFKGEEIKTPFSEVKEQNIIDWIVEENSENGVNLIQSNLEKQLVQKEKADLPWVFKTFSPFKE